MQLWPNGDFVNHLFQNYTSVWFWKSENHSSTGVFFSCVCVACKVNTGTRSLTVCDICAVCSSVLQSVAVCYSCIGCLFFAGLLPQMSPMISAGLREETCDADIRWDVLQCVAVCCSAVFCDVSQCKETCGAGICWDLLHSNAVCCDAIYVAVCCSAKRPASVGSFTLYFSLRYTQRRRKGNHTIRQVTVSCSVV